jgi:hypothetical protein
MSADRWTIVPHLGNMGMTLAKTRRRKKEFLSELMTCIALKLSTRIRLQRVRNFGTLRISAFVSLTILGGMG